MEAIGRLAGGVAHDFNNLLTVITGYAEIVSAKLAESELMKDEIGEIRKAAARATALTRQLLAFSRRQITQPVQLNLGVIVTDLTKMLKRLIGEDIELDVRLSSEPTWIKADPVQIEQILMNLCVNSRDAMPNGGRLVLMSSRKTVENERSVGKNILKPGNYVIFEVTDTGVGMSEETLSHIFEPFFTTKEIGKGTGLGLATVFGVVEECGGVIEVQSEMGRGTSMYVYFPESVTGNVVPQGPRNGMSSRSRGESVLLVEDDNVVRKLVGHMLVELGYAVTACSNALEAIDHLARSKSNPMDVLLTDVIMPKMSGIELAERTLEFSPQTHIVLMSGYAQKKVTDEFLKKHNVGFIPKPFDRDVLGQKLREVLNRSNSKCAHEAKLL
jgi:two-component system cell cycle sensor histidine kinase/response regulator CckA